MAVRASGTGKKICEFIGYEKKNIEFVARRVNGKLSQ